MTSNKDSISDVGYIELRACALVFEWATDNLLNIDVVENMKQQDVLAN